MIDLDDAFGTSAPLDDPFAAVELFDDDDLAGEEMSGVVMLSDDEVEAQLKQDIDDARDYMVSEFQAIWEEAQYFYEGGTDLEDIKGRSKVVETVVRDSIRNARPSILRTLLQSGSIVKFEPSARASGDLAQEQTTYSNQLFIRCDGYRILNDIITNAALKRFAPVKWYYKRTRVPRYFKFTNVPEAQIDALAGQQNIKILSSEQTGQSEPDELGNVMAYYDVELTMIETKGKVCLSSIPMAEIYFSRNATCVEDARVIGHGRNMTVGEVVDAGWGLEAEDLADLDEYDPELSDHAGETFLRRRSNKEDPTPHVDPTMKPVFICETYAKFDIDGIGVPQLWLFVTGGTSHRLLYKERVNEVPIELINIEQVPNTLVGTSIHDIAKQAQNTTTSVLRGTVDNMHIANNRRLAVHEQLVNMGDVLNTKISAPIRVRAPGMIQEIGVQPMVAPGLALLQYLQLRTERQIGVTSAAQGLDPDALQSTDADAVKNTIMLSQGQIELMARNIAEGLKRVFAGILRLSMAHLPAKQEITQGRTTVTVDQTRFDPDLFMSPNVGLGTNNRDLQINMLTTILGRQDQIMQMMGPNNPHCNLHHIANTQEDLLRAVGLTNVDRYFMPVSFEQGQQIADEMQKAMAEAAAKQIDPQTAYLQAEQLKADANREVKTMEALAAQRLEAMKQEFEAIIAAVKDDLERDKLAQQRAIEAAKINAAQVNEAAVKAEQDASRKAPL